MKKTLLTILMSACSVLWPVVFDCSCSELGKGEWYVSLTATAGDLKDSGNVLGQLRDSQYGYDLHDLKELSPFATPYLTIVFPHPDWGDHAGDYGSDFRGTHKRKNKWTFEVRSDDPNREITLSWSSLADMSGMSLLDTVTGTKVAAQHADQQYTFNMDGETVRKLQMGGRSHQRHKEKQINGQRRKNCLTVFRRRECGIINRPKRESMTID